MTSYVFALTDDADDALVARVLDALETQFPGHDFQCVRDPDPTIENSIIPIHAAASAAEPDDAIPEELDSGEVAEVQQAFQETLSAVKNWKPS